MGDLKQGLKQLGKNPVVKPDKAVDWSRPYRRVITIVPSKQFNIAEVRGL